MDEFGVSPESIVVLDNVIDLEDFDARLSLGASAWDAVARPLPWRLGACTAKSASIASCRPLHWHTEHRQ